MTSQSLAISQLLPFLTFAFVASITPGPSNLLVLGNSARYGFVATLPIVVGSCLGSTALVLIAGFGLGGWLAEHPSVQSVMSWGGAAWMSYLALKIAAQPAGEIRADTDKPTSGLVAAALQVVNPKTWGMALAVIGANADVHRYASLSGVFLLVSIPCLGVWATVGSRLGPHMSTGTVARSFNLLLGAALFASTWIGIWEHG